MAAAGILHASDVRNLSVDFPVFLHRVGNLLKNLGSFQAQKVQFANGARELRSVFFAAVSGFLATSGEPSVFPPVF